MGKKKKQKKRFKNWSLHLMLLPALLLLLIYSYIPLVGNVMAFQKFNPSKGFLGSKWVGLKNFRYVFDLPDIYQIIWNTFYIAILKIIMGIVIPVIVALLLNEITRMKFKRTIQTMIYFPHFLSWVILACSFSVGWCDRQSFHSAWTETDLFPGRSEMVSVYYGSYGYLERVWIWNDCISGSSDRY